jgi:protein O-mannosyl-transferase
VSGSVGRSVPGIDESGAGGWVRIAAAAALVLCTLVAYYPALHAGFIWDDDDYLTGNSTLKDLHGLRRIWLEPGAVPQYYPLVHTTFWIEGHLWGLRPAGYHLSNILWHILSALLVWRLLSRLKMPGAWLAAAIFAAHPVQVESVAWITERKNVLMGFFYLAGLYAYLRPLNLLEEETGPRRRWYLLSLALFLASLASKTVAASFPVTVLLLLWWKRGRLSFRDVLPLLPFFLAGAGMGFVTLWMEKRHVGAQGTEWDLSLVERTLIAGRAFWFYLRMLIVPSRLSFVYPRWSVSATALWQYAFPLAVLGLYAALWRFRHRLGRGPLAAALFYGTTLIPALGFFNIYPMRYTFVADHYQYLAMLGPIVLLAWVAASAARRLRPPASFGETRAERGRPPRWREAGLALVLLLVLSGASWNRARVYRNLETLWLDTTETSPTAWLARYNLACVYLDQRRFDLAIRSFEEAERLLPGDEITLVSLGRSCVLAGRLEEAVRWLEEALRIRPDRTETHNNLGLALFGLGRKAEARVHFQRAVDLDPTYASARRNLANVLVEDGNVNEAATHLRKALELDPKDAQSAYRLGLLMVTSEDPTFRNPAAAVALAERAVRQSRPENPMYLRLLAEAYAQAGSTEKAILALEQAGRVASATGQTDLAPEIQEELRALKSGR